ncbi:MAG: Fic family protein [Phycisphaerales bacterium]|nr:Fic family protein [Phycisphaerales bacterium]
MMTLRSFKKGLATVPTATAWSPAELGQAIGRQELFTKQSPQKLKTLREHALIESAVSSNRIEGVEVDQKRIGTLVFGKSALRDRDEQQVRGYRDALNLIHTQSAKLPVSEQTIRELHRLARGAVGDAGRYKEKDGDIIERFADGRERVRFRPTPARKTPAAMAELTELWTDGARERWVPPLVAVAAFNLDFLCVHPFHDGNGRVSRLLSLLQCHHAGAEVGRYVSLERVIEQNKDRYHETLEQSSAGWHEGKHNPWPFINYALWIVREAYKEFEQRVGDIKAPPGEKSRIIVSVIKRMIGDFSIAQLQRECPSVSVDMIRHVLKQQREQGHVTCLGRGRTALWRRTGK